MEKDRSLKAKTFFQLGVAFARFSSKPSEAEYETLKKAASPLGLELPPCGTLLTERGDGVAAIPEKWFDGSDKDSLKNYSRMGTLSFALLLLALGKKELHEGAAQELRALFRAEALPEELLDGYLTDLKSGDAAATFRGFLPNFFKAVDNAGRSELKIIDDPASVPPDFPEEVVKVILLLNDEISVCYRNECYWASIALCGKLVETFIANAYRTVFKKDPDVKRIPARRMRQNLRDKGVHLGDEVDTTMDIISECRSAAMHGNTRIPDRDEALAVGLFTRNLIGKIFLHFRELNSTAIASSGSTHPAPKVPELLRITRRSTTRGNRMDEQDIMNAGKAEKFFWVGVGFLRFEGQQTDSNYEFIRRLVAALELKVPGQDELLERKKRNVIHPPEEWFTGPEGDSMKNCFYIGNISYRMFAFVFNQHALPENERKLLAELLRRERISIEILDRYAADLETGDAEAAWDAFCENLREELSQIALKRLADKLIDQ